MDKRLLFLKGKYCDLYSLTADDIYKSDWISWLNDEDNNKYSTRHRFPHNFETQNDYLKTISNENNIPLGIICKDGSNQMSGVISLSSIDYISRRCDISIRLGINNPARALPVFLESWSLMLKHGFQELNMNKISGGTYHPQVVKTLESNFNFKCEGLLKDDVYSHNNYHDCHVIAVFRDTVKYPKL